MPTFCPEMKHGVALLAVFFARNLFNSHLVALRTQEDIHNLFALFHTCHTILTAAGIL
jgi:hypothetical protein